MKKRHKQESDLGKAAENSSRVLSATESSKPAPSKRTDVKITAAQGRPMLSWGRKRPLSHVIAFPAQHMETFDPVGAGLVPPDQGRRPKKGAASSAPTKRNPRSATRIRWDCFALFAMRRFQISDAGTCLSAFGSKIRLLQPKHTSQRLAEGLGVAGHLQIAHA